MHLPKYAVTADLEHITYEFISSGPNGNIKKIVKFKMIAPKFYNLLFGDWDEKLQILRDDTRSNNKDCDKVLATVAATVINFIRYHPDAFLFVRGQTSAKTKLYQMGINSNWHDIGQMFDVEGFIEGVWQPFENNKNYTAFLLKAKSK